MIYGFCMKTRYFFTLLDEPKQFSNFFAIKIRRLLRFRVIKLGFLQAFFCLSQTRTDHLSNVQHRH